MVRAISAMLGLLTTKAEIVRGSDRSGLLQKRGISNFGRRPDGTSQTPRDSFSASPALTNWAMARSPWEMPFDSSIRSRRVRMRFPDRRVRSRSFWGCVPFFMVDTFDKWPKMSSFYISLRSMGFLLSVAKSWPSDLHALFLVNCWASGLSEPAYWIKADCSSGLENKNPCISWQPIAARWSRCSVVSTPSAVMRSLNA